GGCPSREHRTPTPRRADTDRGGSGAAAERGGGTRSGRVRQSPARHATPTVDFAEGIQRRACIMISSDFLAKNSTYIENLMRHRFVYDVSRLLLLRMEPELVTVLRSEVDDAGVDLVK